ncbi:MAG: cytochrome P450 [Hyphomicrobiaceae bacterium]|nr:cytochrome P450 [Hyphomicrobiaceae bacterium]
MTATYTPADPAVRADPYPQFARLRDEDPVHWSPALKSWVLTRYDDVARALSSAEDMSPDRLTPFYAAMPEPGRSILAEAMRYFTLWIVFRDPPGHTRVRALVAKAFLPGTIAGWRPTIATITERLLDDLSREGTGETDLVAKFTMQLPARVIMALMSVSDRHLHDIKAWSDDIMAFLFSAREIADKYQRAAHGARAMAGLFRDLIAERRRTPGDDLLSLLITARDADDHLTEDELVATAMLLLFAGHETTTNLLSNATLALLRNPETRERFVSEPDNVGAAIEELLRFDGPSNSMSRVVRRTHVVGGKQLTQGDRVFAMINAANRDPRHFALPERLDLGRQPNRHLTFGQGPHFCIGAQLARLETRIALPRLLERFPDLATGQSGPVWHDSLIARGLSRLPVRIGKART